MSSSRCILGPNAVAAALDARESIERLLVARGSSNARIKLLIERCRQAKIPIRDEPRNRLDKLAGGTPHQGVVALAAEKRYDTLDALLGRLERNALLVALDGVEDPRNLGAIIRSAHAAGADAVLVAARRAAPLSETAGKAAAGALEHLPVVRVTNLNQALEELKRNGFWSYGLDERGKTSYDEPGYEGRAVLVMGSEGRGLSRLTAERCDFLVRIPVVGRIGSLNVSVAAGIVLFEALRKRTLVNSSE